MESGYGRPRPSHNATMTEVGPGTPAGELLRRYWQPVGLSSELGDLPTPVRVLGEDLVLFRDGHGRPGLLDAHCCHRGTSLEYGRIVPSVGAGESEGFERHHRMPGDKEAQVSQGPIAIHANEHLATSDRESL